MDPSSSPWSYAYNRIIPSATSGNTTDEYQHPHLTTITAAGQSAQSLLLQAAHSGIASFNAGSTFVPPSPISGYNPVFQQIYHHAAATSVQPKPAHYASAVNTSHRQIQIPPTIDKQQLSSFPNHTSSSPSTAANVTSNYYGENSSSSGASPSPTTNAVTSTTLSWNNPMISNSFLAMQQQQQPQHHTPHNIVDKVAVEEPPKPAPAKKAPRKRQPKKTLVAPNNDFASRNIQSNRESSQQQLLQQHRQQLQQNQQTQQNNQTYYDFNHKWNSPVKIENSTASVGPASISIPTYVNQHHQQQNHQHHQQEQQQHQQQAQNVIPQPAHLQSSQAHSHLSQIPSYYPAFPQQIATQYTTCMNQTAHTLFNLSQQQQVQQQAQLQEQTQHIQSEHQQQSIQQQQPQMEQVEATATTVANLTPSNNVTSKVIVPNIEEELGFLSDDPKQPFLNNNISVDKNIGMNSVLENVVNNTNFGIRNPQSIPAVGKPQMNIGAGTPNFSTLPYNSKLVDRKVPEKKSQFMDSYLKFLQGDRDESPPPVIKSGRKLNYQKISPTIAQKRKPVVAENDLVQKDGIQMTIGTETCSTSSATVAEGNEINDDGHRVKIISQTQILPKKRPHAQNIGSSMEQCNAQIVEQQQNKTLTPQFSEPNQQNASSQQNNYRLDDQQSNCHQDPLALPPRREQCVRRAKQRSIQDMMLTTLATNVGTEDHEEPDEFADSDTDPVWTPTDEDGEENMKCGVKRKSARRNKVIMKKNDDAGNSGALTCNAVNELNSQQQSIIDATIVHNNQSTRTVTQVTSNSAVGTDVTSTVSGAPLPNSTEFVNQDTSRPSYGNTITPDNFKTGDFIVLRSDLVIDWPTIWQVDSKCILQKYEPFCQNGKMFYRNMSKYASWNLETKKLYLKAPVRTQIQSHTETVVEFMRSELLADDTEQFIEKIMEDYLSYRDHFEIYIQTMISQVLDPSFFSEITREKDEYFLSSVRTIDDIMENCKRNLLSITPWTRSLVTSIETWPKCHVFTEWGQNNLTQKNCAGCHQPGISVRFLLFGQPYNLNTMQAVPTDTRITYEKDILLCRICAARADIFHKIAHEKYNLFINCSRRVSELQQENPDKSSTEVLNDLLAEHNWVDELFRNMRNSWAEVESLERQKRFREVSQQ